MSDSIGEFALINWIRQQSRSSSDVLIGPGDDTAAYQWPGQGQLLITTDMLLEGSCFLREAGGRRIGRKAMAVNLSDIAAMAGRPLLAVVSVGLPREGGRELGESLHLGLCEMADELETIVIGGDTNTWDGPLSISVTVVGVSTGSGPVRRSGAKPGDWIFVTGPLGGSILGKHLDFTPRVREALRLHQEVSLHSMIDISDGLTQDLHHICEESQCGAVLVAELIPLTKEAHQMKDGKSALEHALSDGEDFELIFTVDERDGHKLQSDTSVTRIGEIVESGFWIEEKGKRRELKPQGYTHELR